MLRSHLAFDIFRFLLPLALLATTFLYLYPGLLGCQFPTARRGERVPHVRGNKKVDFPTWKAPFRLLALADPQLEGDTSLPDANAPAWPSLQVLGLYVWQKDVAGFATQLIPAMQGAATHDLPKLVQGYRKKLDLLGNDLYLAHIYRTVHWWTQPTHVVVLGDLLGSQWIGDEEFSRRSRRFWHKVFKGARAVPADVMNASPAKRTSMESEAKEWKQRIMAVAGNHDIGYAGDINDKRVARFEAEFGRVNWDMRLSLPGEDQSTDLHIVVLNSMNLDEPALDQELRQRSLDFLSSMETPLDSSSSPTSQSSTNRTATLLLTHIPLHKPSGICVDGPFFSHFQPWEGGGIKEQNHLSEGTSDRILAWLTNHALQSQAFILTGHDHEGCDTYHYRTSSSTQSDNAAAADEEDSAEPTRSWAATPYSDVEEIKTRLHVANGVREVTVRSMMGEFSGNAGLLSAWWDDKLERWRFEYDVCPAGVQHIWWAVHGFDAFVLGLLAVSIVQVGMDLVADGVEERRGRASKDQRKKKMA